MYQKGDLYYADWYERNGKRKRKSFLDAEAARAYECAKKEAVRPGKRQGEGQRLQTFSPQASKPEFIHATTGQQKRLSNYMGESGRVILDRHTSKISTSKSTQAGVPSQGATGRQRLEPVHDLWIGVREVIKVDICRGKVMAITMEDGTEKAVSE